MVFFKCTNVFVGGVALFFSGGFQLRKKHINIVKDF